MATALPLKRLLLVDDNDALCQAVKRAMLPLGYAVDVAASAEEAIRVATTASYPTVVTDLRLPGMNGIALIERLQPRHTETAFILLTGASEIDLGNSASGGTHVASVLSKPIDAGELVKAIERANQMVQRREKSNEFDLVETSLESNVLIVEDNAADAHVLSRLLQKIGWRKTSITHVERLNDAIEAIRARPYGLLLTDLTLPDARGHDAVAALHRTAPTTPIIVLSGMQDEEIALQALELGAQDFLLKNALSAAALHRTIRHSIERKRVEQRLTHMAHHDQLTGLANRVWFRERMLQALQRATRKDEPFSVLVLDLDRFKAVNDALGHDVGDSLLMTVAHRLMDAARECDVVARLGGDEFAILLDTPSDEHAAERFAGRVLDMLREPMHLGGERFVVTTSIGIAVYPSAGDTIDRLLTAADEAMYDAKRTGRNNVRTFSAARSQAAQKRRALEHDLHNALGNNEFVLHYQPQYDLNTGRAAGVEALLRWQRPGHGLVPPLDFIPMLEETGLIRDVGRWVLKAAMEQLVEWDIDDLRMAVNLSPLQFEEDGLVDDVAAVLRSSQIAPSRLELEITESVLMSDTVRTNSTLQGLKSLGARIAIDDFGTGHSSLAYLTRFNVDVLKIDRSFITDLSTADSNERKVAAAVIALGHNLGLEVVAEGIETDEQVAVLRSEGCDIGQGYLLGRPSEDPRLVPLSGASRPDPGYFSRDQVQ